MWHTMSSKDVSLKINTNMSKGLTKEEVIERREKYGINKLEEVSKESIFVKFIKQFNDFMIIILIIAAIVSALISYF